MKLNVQTGALEQKERILNTTQRSNELHINNIVILGDSVALGYGTKGGIARHLKNDFPNSQVMNFGINGLTSNGLNDRLRSGVWEAAIASADLVLLNIGGNDLLQGFRGQGAKGLVKQFSKLKRTYRKNLLEIYRHIKDLNGDALIVQNNLYNSMKKEVQYFGFTGLLLKVWNSAIGEEGIIVSRTDSMGKNPAIWLDSIHPNDEGYKQMHEILMKTLSSTGIIVPTEKTN